MGNKELIEKLRSEGIHDERVLKAMTLVPRDAFVSASDKDKAYLDIPLEIGYGQAISQPYIVALMTSALEPKKTDKILEIGTGSGYQAAILSRLAKEIVTIDRIRKFSEIAQKRFRRLGIKNIRTLHGDGYEGCPGEAPFDSIILTSAPNELPNQLMEQLKEGGTIVSPIGTEDQVLVRYRKKKGNIKKERMLGVRFVPMLHGKNET